MMNGSIMMRHTSLMNGASSLEAGDDDTIVVILVRIVIDRREVKCGVCARGGVDFYCRFLPAKSRSALLSSFYILPISSRQIDGRISIADIFPPN